MKQKSSSRVGRPKHVAEYVEGKEAISNLKEGMKRIFAYGKPPLLPTTAVSKKTAH